MANEFNLIESFTQTSYDDKGRRGIHIKNNNGSDIYVEVIDQTHTHSMEWDYSPERYWREKLGFSEKNVKLEFKFLFPKTDGGILVDARYKLNEKYPNNADKTDLEIFVKFHTCGPKPSFPYDPLLTTNMPTAEDFLAATRYLVEKGDLKAKVEERIYEATAVGTEEKRADEKRLGEERKAWLYIFETNYSPVKKSHIMMGFKDGKLYEKGFEKEDSYGADGKKLVNRISKKLVIGDTIGEILAKNILGPKR